MKTRATRPVTGYSIVALPAIASIALRLDYEEVHDEGIGVGMRTPDLILSQANAHELIRKIAIVLERLETASRAHQPTED